MHPKPVGFEIKRLSLDESKLDIPMDTVTLVWHEPSGRGRQAD